MVLEFQIVSENKFSMRGLAHKYDSEDVYEDVLNYNLMLLHKLHMNLESDFYIAHLDLTKSIYMNGANYQVRTFSRDHPFSFTYF